MLEVKLLHKVRRCTHFIMLYCHNNVSTFACQSWMFKRTSKVWSFLFEQHWRLLIVCDIGEYFRPFLVSSCKICQWPLQHLVITWILARIPDFQSFEFLLQTLCHWLGMPLTNDSYHWGHWLSKLSHIHYNVLVLVCSSLCPLLTNVCPLYTFSLWNLVFFWACNHKLIEWVLW